MSKQDFKKLFREAFHVDGRWADWFLDKVYRDEEALFVRTPDNKAVSTMLVSPYPFAFHGSELESVYISCVATARNERGKGYMHQLMDEALLKAYDQGAALAMLIPASRHLYFVYDKFEFATVFYCNELRYTSLHVFRPEHVYVSAEPDYEMFSRLEALRPVGVRHSAERYAQAVTDVQLGGGAVVAVKGENAEGMAFVAIGSEARVLDILADNDDATEAVLAEVRRIAGNRPIIINGVPAEVASDETRRGAALRARGMARVVNVQLMLQALAKAYHDIDQVIKVSDPVIAQNNDIFTVHRGQCTRTPDTKRRPTIDVSVDVLTRLLFSAPSIGDIFGLKTHRPFISLMLD